VIYTPPLPYQAGEVKNALIRFMGVKNSHKNQVKNYLIKEIL